MSCYYKTSSKRCRYKNNEIDYTTEFVYDDDAIRLLSSVLNIDEELADKFRRCLSKNKWKKKIRNYLMSYYLKYR